MEKQSGLWGPSDQPDNFTTMAFDWRKYCRPQSRETYSQDLKGLVDLHGVNPEMIDLLASHLIIVVLRA
jgi:hypothetical protein